MTAGAEYVGENETLADRTRKMRDLDVCALPVCGEDNRLTGMVTDRDIAIQCVTEGKGPTTSARPRAGRRQARHDRRRRLGRGDPHHEANTGWVAFPSSTGHDLVGMVSQADVARNIEESEVGDLVEAISN